MTTAAPPEKMMQDAVEQRTAQIERWLSGHRMLNYTDATWLIGKLREAARRLAPRVGDGLHALWPWLEHRNSCGRAGQDDLPVEVKCSCGLDDVIAALSAPPAASADERLAVLRDVVIAQLSLWHGDHCPGMTAEHVADKIIGILGYRKSAAQVEP